MGQENCSSALQPAQELGQPFPGGIVLTLARSAGKRCGVGFGPVSPPQIKFTHFTKHVIVPELMSDLEIVIAH